MCEFSNGSVHLNTITHETTESFTISRQAILISGRSDRSKSELPPCALQVRNIHVFHSLKYIHSSKLGKVSHPK